MFSELIELCLVVGAWQTLPRLSSTAWLPTPCSIFSERGRGCIWSALVLCLDSATKASHAITQTVNLQALPTPPAIQIERSQEIVDEEDRTLQSIAHKIMDQSEKARAALRAADMTEETQSAKRCDMSHCSLRAALRVVFFATDFLSLSVDGFAGVLPACECCCGEGSANDENGSGELHRCSCNLLVLLTRNHPHAPASPPYSAESKGADGGGLSDDSSSDEEESAIVDAPTSIMEIDDETDEVWLVCLSLLCCFRVCSLSFCPTCSV